MKFFAIAAVVAALGAGAAPATKRAVAIDAPGGVEVLTLRTLPVPTVDAKGGFYAEYVSAALVLRLGADAVLALAGGDALEKCIDGLRKGGRVAYPNGVEPVPKPREEITVVPYVEAGRVLGKVVLKVR